MLSDGQVGEIDALVGLIARIEHPEEAGQLADRVCEAVCGLTSLTRAALFMYEPDLGLTRPAGSHGVEAEVIAHVAATLEEMPVAQRALAEDRVIEVSKNLEFEVPPRYAGKFGISTMTCAPVAAGNRWFGILVADQGGDDYALSEEDHQTVHTIGRLAAMAAMVERSTVGLERARSLDARIGLIREIHDRVVQRLFGLSLALGAGRELSVEELDRCSEEITSALADLRSTLSQSPAPRERPKERSLEELVDSYLHLGKIELDWSEGVTTPEDLESIAQSVVVEGLRNAQRHSSDGTVRVTVGIEDDAFAVEVLNDRIDPQRGSGGMGLRLLTLEALQHNALFEFGPHGNDQWRVRLLAPIGQ
ncbi:MAG: GAF domain-containing protein [Thermoleophilia bacterium]|nr:GAF domain-containing protein [Thermoleophilia bacterium]